MRTAAEKSFFLNPQPTTSCTFVLSSSTTVVSWPAFFIVKVPPLRPEIMPLPLNSSPLPAANADPSARRQMAAKLITVWVRTFFIFSPFLIGHSRLSMSKSRSLPAHASQSCVSAILSTFTGVTRHVGAASFGWVNPMNNHQLIAAAILVFCVGLLGQDSHKKSLLVNGKVVPSGVSQTQGRLYVDVQDLAHTLGGSVSLQGDTLTMTLPGANATSDPQTAAGHLSADFQRTAITALSEMRE